MAQTQQTMAEFTFAPGETNVVGDRFSPSVLMFWLKTSVAASSTRVQYKSPNTLFGLIPLGAQTQTIPLRNIASVDTNTKFNVGSFVWGVIFAIAGFAFFSANAAVAIVLLLLAVANLCNIMSAQLDFINQAGGKNSIVVSVLEKNKLMTLAQEIQARVFADLDSIRHQESMDIAQKQFTAQTNSVLLQQQMLQAQQAAQAQYAQPQQAYVQPQAAAQAPAQPQQAYAQPQAAAQPQTPAAPPQTPTQTTMPLPPRQ